MKPFVEISQLQKKLGNFQLGPIDLSLDPGTITALVASNGSGKSTLLKLMMNLATPDSGSIKLFGQPVNGPAEEWKSHVAYQPQTIVGWSAYNGKALRNLISALYNQWDEKLFQTIVDLFHIPLDKKFAKLSEGEQQKLCLALTIPRNADLLLLDEPTAFLDIPSRKHLMDILVHWMDQGERSILIASHQAEDIKKLADYLFLLRNGENLGNFEKEELTEGYTRYWLSDTLPVGGIPGEVSRTQSQLISNQPDQTEAFFNEQNIQWINQTTLDLEEIITILLTK